MTLCRIALFVFILTALPQAIASSAYVGYTHSEQQSLAGERVLNFSPTGNSAQFVFDLTDQLAITLDAAKLDDTLSLSNSVDGGLTIQSWSAGVSYYWGDWLISANYSHWQDELSIALLQLDQQVFEQYSDSPSSAISIGYGWDSHQWQMGVVAGFHYGDWKRKERFWNNQTRQIQSSVDKGGASFVSLSLPFARMTSLATDNDLVLGGSIGWNQLISSESTAISRNGRNISQIGQRIIANRLGAIATTGTESYGQLNLYAAYHLTAHWVLDMDSTFDLGGEENSHAWSFNIGYQF